MTWQDTSKQRSEEASVSFKEEKNMATIQVTENSLIVPIEGVEQIPSQKTHMPLIVRVLFGFLLVTLSLVGGLLLIIIALIRAMRIKWFRERLRGLNKGRVNPMTLNFAGGRSGIWVTLTHVGRHSGRAYTTPLLAQRFGDGFLLALFYGADVDWCRNVLAAGKCTLTWHEQEYPLERPELLERSEAMKAFPVFTRVLYTAGGINQFLWVHQQKEVPVKVSANDSLPLPTSPPAQS
jgi:deazaflavin-dependent oxidoreductase (nitroreductase family)